MKKVLIILSILFTVAGLSLLIWFVILFINHNPNGNLLISTTEQINSNAGEFINGIVGVLFTIVGSFLLFVTLNYQREEYAETQKMMLDQQFETTFFNMISMLGQIREAISGNFSSEQKDYVKGQAFINLFILELKDKYDSFINNDNEGILLDAELRKTDENIIFGEFDIQNINSVLNDFYLAHYSKYHSQLGHYFRYIFNIIKYVIDNRKLSNDDKKYIDLLQAQLSNDELSLIFYNAISNNGLNTSKQPQFKIWIEQYQFLENLDCNSLVDRRHYILYPKTRFKFLNRDELQNRS